GCSCSSVTKAISWIEMESSNSTHGPYSINETTTQNSQTDRVEKSINLPIFMFAGGAVGNLIAIIVLSVSRQQRKSSAFYTLVCGLAVTDLLGTCLASPITIANYLNPNVLLDQHVCEFQSFLLLFFGLTGLSIICTMAAERYLAICCPYTYQRWGVDRRFAQKLLLFIYISHIFFCCLPMMGMANSTLQPSETWCFIDWRKHDPVSTTYFVLYSVVSLLLILGTILLNLAVCGALLMMRQRVVQLPVTRGSVRERWRALSSAAETQMIAVLVMTSVVVLASMHAVSLNFTDLAAIRIASVNPILDPWIYILLRKSLLLVHRLNATPYPSIVADSVHPFTSTVYASEDKNLKSSHTGLLNMTASSRIHQISIQQSIFGMRFHIMNNIFPYNTLSNRW
uniref:G-protein coupled receptors family 1 profile domain-containing protein n=1 Tax=Maylandia zebra TaxID=106582 RepID=A0A3P9CJU1_9CICH